VSRGAGVDRVRLLRAVAGAAIFAALAVGLALAVDVDAAGRIGWIDAASLGGDRTATFVFVTYRVPRVLAALLVGGALAGAGVAFQAVLHNPMAEPYTLGVSSGSALAAVVALRFGVAGAFGTAGVGAAAMIGAGVTIALVWHLARTGEGLPAATLLLAGITISMFAAAASMLVQYTADLGEVY
jgi:iron complex transport system permease protein